MFKSNKVSALVCTSILVTGLALLAGAPSRADDSFHYSGTALMITAATNRSRIPKDDASRVRAIDVSGAVDVTSLLKRPVLFPNLQEVFLHSNDANNQTLLSLAENYPRLRLISIEGGSQISEEGLNALRKFPVLDSLVLTCALPETPFDRIPRGIRVLVLSGTPQFSNSSMISLPRLHELVLVTPSSLTLLQRLVAPELTSVKFSQTDKLDRISLDALHRFPLLQRVVFHKSSVSATDLSALIDGSILCFDDATIHADNLKYAANARSACEKGARLMVREQATEWLAAMQQWNPKALVLRCKVNSQLADSIKEIGSLREIDMAECEIDKGVLAKLSELPGLANLDLSSTNVTDADLADFSRNKTLSRLLLNNTKVTGIGLESLPNVPIWVLHIGGSITNDGLAAISHMPYLRELRIDLGTVPQHHLSCLGGLTHLRQLDVNGASLTDEALFCLESCRALKKLRLSGAFSDQAVSSFQAHRPQCRITSNPTER